MSPEKVVLVALDGSRESTRALALARALAHQLHARVAAIHVVARPLAPETDVRALVHVDAEEWRDISLVVHTGEPAAMILAEVAAPATALLVMTASAAGEPVRAVGSVAMNVIANARRPIVIVRPEIAPAPPAGAAAIKRLLVPLDGTVETAGALREATKLAHQLGATAEILYVAQASGPAQEQQSIAGRRYVDQPQHEWRSWSRDFKDRLAVEAAGFSPSAHLPIHIRQGDPGEEIARFAREAQFDAIVLVRRSRMEPDRANALKRVIELSPCPLIVVGGPE